MGCLNHPQGRSPRFDPWDSGISRLTHLSAELEPLLAWAAMMSIKALEVSENFLMSTGLGTLQGEQKVKSERPKKRN